MLGLARCYATPCGNHGNAQQRRVRPFSGTENGDWDPGGFSTLPRGWARQPKFVPVSCGFAFAATTGLFWGGGFCSYSFKKSGIFLIISLWIKKPWPEQQQNCRGAEQAVVTRSCAVLKAKQQICSGFVLVKGRESCPCSCRVKAIGTATNKHSLL